MGTTARAIIALGGPTVIVLTMQVVHGNPKHRVISPPPTHVYAEANYAKMGDYAQRLESHLYIEANKARRREGFGFLASDGSIATVARRHSADMSARGFFAHVAPPRPGGSATNHGDRLATAGMRFDFSAENLYMHETNNIRNPQQLAEKVVLGWLGSPGHRKNLLDPTANIQGIGVVLGTHGESTIVIITQVLVEK